MLKPDRFSCSQKIRLKWDPPVEAMDEMSSMNFNRGMLFIRERYLQSLY